MGATLRALRALVLLAGFYLLGVVLLAVLAAADWACVTWLHGPAAFKVLIVSVVLAIPIVRGMFMLRTPRGDPRPGVAVTDRQEPVLWNTVREIAEQVGTRAPDEIVLTEEVNAAVSEDARLLGLRPGTRRLYLGLPLMTGLDEMRLRAVLAHEMGHYANLDTRLTPLIARGRAQLIRTVTHFQERSDKKIAKERAKQEKKAAKRIAAGKTAKEIDTDGEGAMYRAMAAIYLAYGNFYMRATLSASRRQELAADLAAVRIAGRDAAAGALRELNALDPAFDFYMHGYATLGVGSGLMPPRGQVFGGFRTMLAARSADLDELRTELSTEPASPYDSHPALAERVARIEALPDDGRGGQAAAARPSLELLADADVSMAALEPAVLAPQALALTRVEWAELVHRSMLGYAGQGAERIREAAAAEGAAPGLAGLLDAIDADPAVRWRLTEHFPKSEQAAAATGRAAREFARSALRRALSQLATDRLADSGTARWQLSWSEPATLRYPAGDFADRLDEALDAAVADQPDTEPLRKLVLAP
ncbi:MULTISPECIES: M48 family metallopeptidase [unclassified Streptomyces]|uniref:M48 family metallopeptidase n=1 Tax=unclassified Streptomyces TaxID=2593676 RepID=UPI001BE6D713|nr:MULTISPECIES: M48 family metallopeptidase [unclassified Streptomyces]MBT2408048.1 M48 family metallopeptidase [Streptomyces sp. ISL-21]MBT2611398.1 M48 family metallopeptidase [Streptomyces sp. ISL-87]